jgi:hypothetical protein
MKQAIRSALALVALVSFVGLTIAAWEATAPLVLTVAGHSYRTSGASQATLGSVGTKLRKGLVERVPRLRDNSAYAREEEDPGWSSLKVRMEASEDQQISRSNLSKLATGNEALASALQESEGKEFTTARYVVLRVASPMRLARELRESPEGSSLREIYARARHDRDLRIVTAAVLAYDFESYRDVRGGFQQELNEGLLAGSTLDLTLADRAGAHRTMKGGVIVGYEYSRFCWADGELDAIRVDGEGNEANLKCPEGGSPRANEPLAAAPR